LEGHAQSRNPKRRARIMVFTLPLRMKEMSINKGKRGMTIKVSVADDNTLSVAPPTYPEKAPSITPIPLPIKTAIPATKSEFRIAKVNRQKTSCPREFVPRTYSREGGWFLGTTRRLLGS
jgi:hypothetical protein